MSEDRPTIRLLIVTPDDVVVDEQVTAVRFQEPDGWRGILPRHTPYLTRLVNGILIYRLSTEEDARYVALYGGTLEVQRDMILVLTVAAEPGADLEELARRLLERQAEADALALEAHIEYTKVRMALVRALTNLPAAPETIR